MKNTQTEKPQVQDVWLPGGRCWLPPKPQASRTAAWGPPRGTHRDSPPLYGSGCTHSFPSKPEGQEGPTTGRATSHTRGHSSALCVSRKAHPIFA